MGIRVCECRCICGWVSLVGSRSVRRHLCGCVYWWTCVGVCACALNSMRQDVEFYSLSLRINRNLAFVITTNRHTANIATYYTGIVLERVRRNSRLDSRRANNVCTSRPIQTLGIVHQFRTLPSHRESVILLEFRAFMH